MRQRSWLRLAAIGTWTVCGLPGVAAIAQRGSLDPSAGAWTVAFTVYGIALIAGFRLRPSTLRAGPATKLRAGATARAAIVLAAVQSVAAVLAGWLTAIALDPTGVGLLVGVGLMVIVAAELPHLVKPAATTVWLGGQTLAIALLVGNRISVADMVTFGLGAAGFQMFASMTTALMLREAAARGELARANAELHATRALLAESSRAGERLRIARDLHDSLGHHLTALNLQLDVASRLAAGKSADHVDQAHAITRLLLAEVRTVVGQMRDGQTDLVRGLRSLAAAGDSIQIHLDVPERLVLDDAAQADSLLRCVQEVITNASRHADARNLWISIEPDDGGIVLHARDDGRGVDIVRCGNGLKGMSERFAEYSGRVEFGARPGEGFEIRGFMPIAQAVS